VGRQHARRREVGYLLTAAVKTRFFAAWRAEEAALPMTFGPDAFVVSLTAPQAGYWPPVQPAGMPLIDPALVPLTGLPDPVAGATAIAFWQARQAQETALTASLRTVSQSGGFQAMLEQALGSPAAGDPLPADVDTLAVQLTDPDPAVVAAATTVIQTQLFMTAAQFTTVMTARTMAASTNPLDKPTAAQPMHRPRLMRRRESRATPVRTGRRLAKISSLATIRHCGPAADVVFGAGIAPHAHPRGGLRRVLDLAGDELAGNLCTAASPGAALGCGQGGDAVGQDLAVRAEDGREGGQGEAVGWRLDVPPGQQVRDDHADGGAGLLSPLQGPGVAAGGRHDVRVGDHVIGVAAGGFDQDPVDPAAADGAERAAEEQPGHDGGRRRGVRLACAVGHDGVQQFPELLIPVLVIAGARQAGELGGNRIGAGAGTAPGGRLHAIQARRLAVRCQREITRRRRGDLRGRRGCAAPARGCA